MKELRLALVSVNGANLDHDKNVDIVTRAGGAAAGWIELRKLEAKLPDLHKHATWLAEQRVWLKSYQKGLEAHEAMLVLDYGGFSDSGGDKFSCWSCTVLTKDSEQMHIDFFFDAKTKNGPPGAKKDGKTGIYFLGELLNPERSPKRNGVSMMKTLFPDVTDLLLTGDTGNGFRAYEMLDELSKVFVKYTYHVVLANLPPGHAWNQSDGRIAHLNVLFNCVKAKGHVFGAKAASEAFSAASNPAITSSRKLMRRSHIFFRVPASGGEANKNFGAQVHDIALHQGRMGVMGFLWYQFSVIGKNGTAEHPEGYARVREYGDPNKSGNKTYVYSWRLDLNKLMCQNCSDSEVLYVRFCVFVFLCFLCFLCFFVFFVF